MNVFSLYIIQKTQTKEEKRKEDVLEIHWDTQLTHNLRSFTKRVIPALKHVFELESIVGGGRLSTKVKTGWEKLAL